MSLAGGDKLGPYEIIALIGKGGMGEVYKARDTRLGRDVAIKVSAERFNDRFEREARAIAALNHPNICTLHDVGPNYLVMEYIDGRPVGGPTAPENALSLTLQMAGALETAHAKGIVHRDLKPANILVTASGVKLLDFGLAKLVAPEDSDATRSIEGTIMGTAAYMSPEQAQGLPTDARSDIFSLGVVLYEMLSGCRAFMGETALATMGSVVRDEPRPLNAPTMLRHIVSRCLCKSPAGRFQSAAELRTALETAAASNLAEKAPSIAILPFANMSGDKENEYFSDGLAEEIINALTQVPGLKITARTSAFYFKGKDVKIAEIARELGVDHVLEGSVRKASNRIRVTAQLIKAADGFHLWSQRYDRELADVFAVQDEIAEAITAALKLKLSLGPAELRRHKPNLAAYEAYLKGRHHVVKIGADAMARAKDYLEQAIALDPEFALAHCELGAYYLQLTLQSLLPAHQAMPIVRQEAQKALDIDCSLPEAHALLGVVSAIYDYDWTEAEARFREAFARDPVPPFVRLLRAYYFLMPLGKAHEAMKELEQVLSEDPLSLLGHLYLAFCLRSNGQITESEAQFRQVIELDPNFVPANVLLCLLLASRGMLSEALALAEKAYAAAPWNPQVAGALAGMLARTGNRSRGEELLKQLGDGTAYGTPVGFYAFHFLNGEIETATDWIERAIEQRYPGVFSMVSSSSRRGLAELMNLPVRDPHAN